MTLDDTFNTFGSMESEHAARGLRFDRSGLGCIPVQAFGQIDGLHFYFRYRSDCASLRVGPFDEALENACWELSEQNRKARVAASEPGDWMGLLDDVWSEREQPGREFLPTRTTSFASIDDVTEDRYNGSLELPEFRELFSRLVGMLAPVPEDEQVSQSTISWLTGGGLWPLPGTAAPLTASTAS